MTKIGVASEPRHETAKTEEYVCGSDTNTKSPFMGYNVEGELLFPVEIGSGIRMMREFRNGVKIDGVFISSIIKDIYDRDETGFTVETDNSIYRIEEI